MNRPVHIKEVIAEIFYLPLIIILGIVMLTEGFGHMKNEGVNE